MLFTCVILSDTTISLISFFTLATVGKDGTEISFPGSLALQALGARLHLFSEVTAINPNSSAISLTN